MGYLELTCQYYDALEAANSELDYIPNNVKVLAIKDLWDFSVKKQNIQVRRIGHAEKRC